MDAANLNDVFIISAKRSPIGKLSGSLSNLSGSQLGAQVIKSVLDSICDESVRNHIVNNLEEVILGQVFTTSAGQNPARQSSLSAGLPNTIPAWSVNMLCGSGLQSVCIAFDRLKASFPNSTSGGWMLAGGQESMSQAPHATQAKCSLRRGATQNASGLPNLGSFSLIDTIMHDGLTDAFHDILMGETAEIVAERFSISRADQDQFALSSQQKYAKAQQARLFDNEIVPIRVPASANNKEGSFVTEDEHPYIQTNLEKLSKLKPVFRSTTNGTVTVGNATGVNDGAAVLLLCRGDQLSDLGSISPLVRIVGWHQAGNDPQVMGLAPIPAIRGLLRKIGWTIDSVNYFEINEAFASQTLAVSSELSIPTEKLNVNGGAIALGHPLGCSGARVLVTLVHILCQASSKSTSKQRGLAALCVGGGMGIAIAVETC